MDANKLAALVDEQNKNPFGEMPEMEYDEGEESSEEEPMSLKERGEELLTSMGDFGEELRESADILVPLAEDIGDDLGGDSEYAEETEEAVVDAVDSMPEHIQQGIADNLAGKPKEDLAAVGDALVRSIETEATPEGEAEPAEAEKVGGLLELAGECCKDMMSDDDESEEDDDMSDMDEDEDLEPNPY